jgi:hypothetical protein
MSRLVPITALILAGTFSVAQADVYRWVDEHGEPHYSDQWVAGSTVIKTSKARPGSDTLSRSADQKNVLASSNKISEQLDDQANARAVHEDVAKTHAAQCKAAQDRYMKAIETTRVYKPGGKDGEREYLSDAELDAYRATARKDVQGLCGSVPVFNPETPLNPQPQPVPEPKVNPALATSQ